MSSPNSLHLALANFALITVSAIQTNHTRIQLSKSNSQFYVSVKIRDSIVRYLSLYINVLGYNIFRYFLKNMSNFTG